MVVTIECYDKDNSILETVNQRGMSPKFIFLPVD